MEAEEHLPFSSIRQMPVEREEGWASMFPLPSRFIEGGGGKQKRGGKEEGVTVRVLETLEFQFLGSSTCRLITQCGCPASRTQGRHVGEVSQDPSLSARVTIVR